MKIKFHDEYYKILDFEIPETYQQFIQILSEVVSPEPLPPTFNLRYRDLEDFPIKVSNQRTYKVMLEEKKNSQNELILFLTAEEKNEDFGDMSNIQTSSYDRTAIHAPAFSHLNYSGAVQYQTMNNNSFIIEPKKEEPGVYQIVVADTPSSTVEGSFGNMLENSHHQRNDMRRSLFQAGSDVNNDISLRTNEQIQVVSNEVNNIEGLGIVSDGIREGLSERIEKVEKAQKVKKEEKGKEKKIQKESKDQTNQKDKKEKVNNLVKKTGKENKGKDQKKGKIEMGKSKELVSNYSTRSKKRYVADSEDEEEKLEKIEKKRQTGAVRSTSGSSKKTLVKKEKVVEEEDEEEDDEDEDEDEDGEEQEYKEEKWRSNYMIETDFDQNALKVLIILPPQKNPNKFRCKANKTINDKNMQIIMKELVEKLGGRSVSHERPVIKDLTIDFKDCKHLTKKGMLIVFQTVTEHFKYVNKLNLDFSYGRYQHKFEAVEGEMELDLRHLQELSLNLRFRPDVGIKEIDEFAASLKRKSRNLRDLKIIRPLRPE